MEIHIENFKGIRKANYSFNPKSTTLICGKSGIGKSSILEAINYLICGDNTRGLANIGSDGKILVKMKIDNFEAVRTNKPKRLIVTYQDKMYEDEHAQSYLDSYFTIFFKDIAYVRQKGASSFLQKSCSEKMDFLRLWITNDKNIQNIKSKLKVLTKDLETKMSSLYIELEVAKKMFNNYVLPETVKNPIPKKYEPTLYQKFKNTQLKTLQKTYSKNYDKHKKICNLLKHEKLLLRKSVLDQLCSNIDIDTLSEERQLLSELKMYTNQLHKIDDKNVEELKLELNTLKQEKIDNEINKQTLSKIKKLQSEISTKSIILSDLHQKYFDNQQLSIKIDNEIDECHKMIKICDKFSDVHTLLTQCIKGLEKYDGVTVCGNLELMFNTEFFDQLSLNVCCPQCNSYLQIIDSNELSVNIVNHKNHHHKTINKSLKELYVEYKKYRTTYENYLYDYSYEKLTTNYRLKLKNKQKELEKINSEIDMCIDINFPKEYTNILDNTIPQLVKQLNKIEYAENELNKLYESHPDIQTCENVEYDDRISQLEKYIHDIEFNNKIQTKIKNIKSKINVDIFELDDKIAEYDELMKCMNEYQSILKIKIEDVDTNNFSEEFFSELRLEKERLRLECSIIQTIMNNIMEFKNQIKLYSEYINKKIEYNDLESDMNILQERYDKMKYKYDNYVILKSVIEKTEGRMIDMFIYDLNEKIQYYVDQFFTDDTMNIDLRCEKNKREQPKLTFNMIYKGNRIEEVKSLSGGEYDRLNLAISLSFADLLNLPLIMFDESVNSLDEVACTNVLEKIKDCNRVTLVVAHQIEEGLFDNTLCIKN